MAAALAPHGRHHIYVARVRGDRQRGLKTVSRKLLSHVRQQGELHGEEGRMRPGPLDRVINHHEINRLIPATAMRSSIQAAQHLQLEGSTYVSPIVKEWNSLMRPMACTSTRRFVKVAPPTAHAGVGEALRQAYRMDGALRSLKTFEDLLDQLD
jgi:hypothetical protein